MRLDQKRAIVTALEAARVEYSRTRDNGDGTLAVEHWQTVSRTMDEDELQPRLERFVRTVRRAVEPTFAVVNQTYKRGNLQEFPVLYASVAPSSIPTKGGD